MTTRQEFFAVRLDQSGTRFLVAAPSMLEAVKYVVEKHRVRLEHLEVEWLIDANEPDLNEIMQVSG